MEQKKLKTELANGELRNLYLLFGEERFLIAHYANEIEKHCQSDKVVFEGAVPIGEIIMAAETVPFSGFSESTKRLIVVRDSKLFASGRKVDSEEMADYLAKIPAETVIIFAESEVDRRTKLFKKAATLGGAIDCSPLPPQDLSKWITRLVKEKGKTIPPATVNTLLRTCGNNMSNLSNETNKLIHYCGKNKEITEQDITEICTPTLESRIFDLTKAVGAGRPSDALKIYRDMLILKESPIMILTMIIRQLRIILLCKCHSEKGTSKAHIAKELNIRDFVISEALSHGRRFTTSKLIAALRNCQDTDVRIKTGLITPETGVEMLIIVI
ncbi:MAG: DNA polymerase III subunit delta [Defluviitaleaceae bacterium]|nr:DNA polymerase III subunit delta [Defluviitaleaceae bacterium]